MGLIHPHVAYRERSRQIVQVLVVTMVLNWSIALLKVIFGLSTHTLVMIADGVHSFSDGLSNVIGLIAVSIASSPADKGHPYGHRKFETIAALVISASLFYTAITIFKESIVRLLGHQQAQAGAYSFGIVAVTLAVNAFTAWWERLRAKKLGSELLLADAWHTLSDIFVTLSVFVALVGIRLGFYRADTLISMAIAVFIGYIAVRILINSSHMLIDQAVIDEEEIRRCVLKIEGVADCHEIRNRGRRDEVSVDLHVLVDPKMTVERSHALANLIEKDLRTQFAGISEVLVHIEPLHHDHRELGGDDHHHFEDGPGKKGNGDGQR